MSEYLQSVLIQGFFTFVLFATAVIVAGAMTKSLGSRKTCFIGLSACSVGITLGVFSMNYYMFLLTFSVIKGGCLEAAVPRIDVTSI